MAGKQQPPKEQLAKPEPVEDIRLIQERVKAMADQTALRIQEHDRRMTDQLQKVDEGSKQYGVQMKWGVPVGLVLLFVVLFYSISPVVKGVVDVAADKIKWDERMKIAADEQLKVRLTSDVLAKAIDNKAIQKAATDVADSPGFKADIRKAAEDAVKKAVVATVNQIIKNNNNFRAIVDEQMRVQRDRYQAAVATLTPVTANNKDELTRALIAAIGEFQKLGGTWTRVDIFPFEDDVVHIELRILWQPEEPEKERVKKQRTRITRMRSRNT
jgi:hypothetical protein